VKPTPQFDSLMFDVLPPRENSRTAVEVDIGRSEVAQALVVPPGVVEVNELSKSGFQLPRQVIVFELDPVVDGAVVTLDFALGDWM
jgi:hypothetical protein